MDNHEIPMLVIKLLETMKKGESSTLEVPAFYINEEAPELIEKHQLNKEKSVLINIELT
jgi:hypothetical protein